MSLMISMLYSLSVTYLAHFWSFLTAISLVVWCELSFFFYYEVIMKMVPYTTVFGDQLSISNRKVSTLSLPVHL